MRVGILSTLHCPFLGYIVRELQAADVSVDAIILDSKDFGEEAQRIHTERTGDHLPAVPLDTFEALHIPYYFVANHSSKRTASLVRDLGLDLLVNGNTPRILKPVILDAPRIGVLSCHPGLLPEFRGCTCVEWAIYLDEQVGNTTFLMNERIDEGPPILREGLTFEKRDDYVDIRVKVYRHSFQLLARSVSHLASTASRGAEQEPSEGRYFGVIDDEKMSAVLEKIENGRYAFQE